MPNLPIVVLPHPIGGSPIDSVLAKLDAAFDEIISKLTTPLAPNAINAAASLQVERIEAPELDEWSELQSWFLQQGWGDGLPLVPPTPERVAAMLRFAEHAPAHLLGGLAPRMGAATIEHLAVNAVMAGCKPIHLPLLIATIEALLDPAFNLYGIQCTTHCCAPLAVVNGPLAATLGVHAGYGLFGPGPWANGPIGRAVRLVLLNVGGAIPGDIDKATFGMPGKFSYCIAENESALPAGWPTLAAERGFGPQTSTVTVIGAEAPHNVNDHESTTAAGLLRMIAGTMSETGQNNVYYASEPLVILSPEHAATIAADGVTKDDVRRALFEQSGIALGRFSPENIERRFRRKFADRYANASLEAIVPIAARAEDLLVIVAGGPGKHSMYLPTFGGTHAVTRRIAHADGRDWRPEEFS